MMDLFLHDSIHFSVAERVVCGVRVSQGFGALRDHAEGILGEQFTMGPGRKVEFHVCHFLGCHKAVLMSQKFVGVSLGGRQEPVESDASEIFHWELVNDDRFVHVLVNHHSAVCLR